MTPSDSRVQNLVRALEILLKIRYPIELPSEYRYAHLSLALIDTVFSLGARYESTRNTVLRYARHAKLKPFRPSVDAWPPTHDQEPLSKLEDYYRREGLDRMLTSVYQNRQRTSTHPSSITKAQAVCQAAEVLTAYHVQYFQDVPRIMDDPAFEADFRSIKGQGPGTILFADDY